MMRVRGHDNTQPLVVLNGKIIELPKDVNHETMNSEEQLTSLLNINTEDVESIAVLQKDEATKLWGDKGANGVIVITTRNGQQDAAAEASNDTIYNGEELYRGSRQR